MFDPIFNARLARERYQDLLREAERNRLASRARQGQLTLPRRAARPLGRVLLRLGVSLLRYGLVETPTTTRPYHPSARSIEMN
jgi:hypothetical protein